MTLEEDLNRIFREEANELIENLMDLMAQLARSDGALYTERIKDTLRVAHNLKGAATSTGYWVIESLAHAFEGVLVQQRDADGPLSKALLSLGIDALSVMQAMVSEEASDDEVQEILERLVSAGGDPSVSTSGKKQRDNTGEKGEKAAAGTDRESPDKKTKIDPDDQSVKQDSAIRVDTTRLDSLIGFIGEFLTFRARLNDRIDRQAEVFRSLQSLFKLYPETQVEMEPIIKDLRRLVREGRKDLLDFANLTDAMSDTAKQLRTVPIRGAVHIWRRVVRESSTICSKDVQMEVSVGRVEIDRYVLERLHDPMMHLLRNAVDHGIESPSKRTSIGKPSQGRILVSATLQGAMIRLEVSDDGRGIDFDKVRKKAVEYHLITEEEAMQMNDDQAAEILFRTGFSTTRQVNRISGRGVGLDVVRCQLEALGGSVEFASESTLGGTSIVLWVPVSILSSEGLFVRCGKAVYAFPIESVVQTIRLEQTALRKLEGYPVIKIENEDPIRVMKLSKLMGVSDNSSTSVLNIVVLSRGSRKLGIVVDEVAGLREYVIHGLPWNYQNFPGISGAILEADGSVAILIDVMYLFDGTRKQEDAFNAKSTAVQKVLLVDDSLSSRTLQQAMLRADGYDVTLASDGLEAWQLLQEGIYDLVVSDIQMPQLDGLELTRRIRSASRLKDLPVILVTSLSNSEDRAAGADAGADDYLIKGAFDQRELLGIVSKYLGKR